MQFRRLPLALAFVATAPFCTYAQIEPEAPATASSAPAATPPSTPTPALPAPATPSAPVSILTLEECIRRALGKNFDLQIQGFGTESAKDSLVIARAAFDPALDVSVTSGYDRVQGRVVDQDSASVGVSQRLATGATVSASRNLSRTKDVPARSTPNPAYDSDVALTVRQPLLRNAGTRVTRAAIERARLGVDIANLDFKSTVLAVVRNVEAAYYNLAFAREQLLVRRFSLQVAERLLEENQSRRATGVATDLEVLQAEVGVANARRNLLLAEQSVKDREDALLAEIEPFGFNAPLGQVQLVEEPIPTVNGDMSFKLARDNTPEYLAQQVTIEQLKIDSDVARRNRLPTLDLTGSAGYSARDRTYGTAARNVWDRDEYTWTVDATLSFPWGLRADRARYRQSLNTLNREQVRLQQIEQDILVQVRAAVRSVETNLESVRISQLATRLSERQYELEKARYDAGLSTFRRVQEAQEDLDAARVSEVQAKVALRIALADLYRLEGTSLSRYNINLEQ
jgi:outer membrane protein